MSQYSPQTHRIYCNIRFREQYAIYIAYIAIYCQYIVAAIYGSPPLTWSIDPSWSFGWKLWGTKDATNCQAWSDLQIGAISVPKVFIAYVLCPKRYFFPQIRLFLTQIKINFHKVHGFITYYKLKSEMYLIFSNFEYQEFLKFPSYFQRHLRQLSICICWTIINDHFQLPRATIIWSKYSLSGAKQ